MEVASQAHCLVVAAQHNGDAIGPESGAPDPSGMPLSGLEGLSSAGIQSMHRVDTCRPLVLYIYIIAVCYPRAQPLTAPIVKMHG